MAHTYSSIIIHSASNVEMGFSFDKLCTPKSQVLDFDIEDSEQVLEIISIFIKEDVDIYTKITDELRNGMGVRFYVKDGDKFNCNYLLPGPNHRDYYKLKYLLCFKNERETLEKYILDYPDCGDDDKLEIIKKKFGDFFGLVGRLQT